MAGNWCRPRGPLGCNIDPEVESTDDDDRDDGGGEEGVHAAPDPRGVRRVTAEQVGRVCTAPASWNLLKTALRNDASRVSETLSGAPSSFSTLLVLPAFNLYENVMANHIVLFDFLVCKSGKEDSKI